MMSFFLKLLGAKVPDAASVSDLSLAFRVQRTGAAGGGAGPVAGGPGLVALQEEPADRFRAPGSGCWPPCARSS